MWEQSYKSTSPSGRRHPPTRRTSSPMPTLTAALRRRPTSALSSDSDRDSWQTSHRRSDRTEGAEFRKRTVCLSATAIDIRRGRGSVLCRLLHRLRPQWADCDGCRRCILCLPQRMVQLDLTLEVITALSVISNTTSVILPQLSFFDPRTWQHERGIGIRLAGTAKDKIRMRCTCSLAPQRV